MNLPSRLMSCAVKEVYPYGVDPYGDKVVDKTTGLLKGFEHERTTVDRLLDTVDVTLDWYVPSNDAIEFIMFIRLVLGEEPENSNPKPHYFCVDCIFQNPNVIPYFTIRNIDFEALKSETVVLCSREFSKSTLVTYLILFMAYKCSLPNFGKINYGLYVSDSMRNGVKKMMGRLKGVYQESRFLQNEFEEVHITQEEATFIVKPRTPTEIANYKQTVEVEKKGPEFVIGRMKRTFKVDGLGCMTSSRGASNVLVRPQFVFIDDVVSNEVDASSQTILDSIESTIESDIRGGLSGTGYVIIAIGTPFNKFDPIYRRIEEGLMLPVVFPRAESMPTNNLKEEDFKSVWPDRHTYAKCRREYTQALKAKEGPEGNKTKMRKLTQEHYLRISSSDDRMIPDELIQWFDRTLPMRAIQNYSLYITTDFTTTGEAKSDFSALSVWAINSSDDWYLMDVCVKRQGIGEQYDELFRMVREWSNKGSTLEVGVEVDGQQKAHVYALKEEMLKRNTFFTFARQKGAKYGKEGILSKNVGGNKHSRFRMILPQFQNKKIYFAEQLKDTPDMEEGLNQLFLTTWYGFSGHDDWIDTLSMVGAMEVILPMGEYEPTKEDRQDSIWDDIYAEDEGSAYGQYS